MGDSALKLRTSNLPRRILHVIATVHPNAGGPSTVVTRLAAAQAALGHEVTILSFLPSKSMGVFEECAANIPGFDRVQLILKPFAKSTRWLMRGAHRRELKRTLGSAEVVHLHGVWEPVLLLAARMAHAAGIPYVVRPCGMLDPWSLRQRAMKKWIALAAGYRWMLNHASCLHTVNADENRLIGQLGLTCRTEVISNGVFLEEIHPLPKHGTFHDKHPELGGKPYVLFLSRLHHKKGLDFLVESFEKVCQENGDVQLVIAGPDAGGGGALAARIAAGPVARRIHVVGALYGKEKLEALSDAAVYCLPSRQEGFSLATSEALAAGVPVVITEACHFPEVGKVGAGRVVGLKVDALAGAMVEILRNPVLRCAMGKAGRQLMESRYTWSAVAARCEEMYAGLEGAGRGAGLMGVVGRIVRPVARLGRVALGVV